LGHKVMPTATKKRVPTGYLTIRFYDRKEPEFETDGLIGTPVALIERAFMKGIQLDVMQARMKYKQRIDPPSLKEPVKEPVKQED